MRRITTAALVALMAALAPAGARAQHDGHGTDAPAMAGPYAPRLGDFMIMQQIRHSKLWFAVAAGNWPLAGHELDALKDGFDDVARLYPTVQDTSLAPVIDALKAGEMAEIAAAIAAQDKVKFAIGFDKLTAACNACHRVTRHGFIVIQQPISPPFNNQSFSPVPGQDGGLPHPH